VTTSAKIIADSIAGGVRLTTLEIVLPRYALAQFNTHRVFSKSFESSRAIPVRRRIAAIREHPYIPSEFGKNQKGMQAGEALDARESVYAEAVWREALASAMDQAEQLARLGVHKELANRLLEPFAYVRGIVTATEWDNFFALRLDSHAQGDIRELAEAMKAAMNASTPLPLLPGDWHLPYLWDNEIALLGDERVTPTEDWVKASCARCARVSYLNHDGKRDIEKDLALYDRLVSAGHMSALEHAAQVVCEENRWQYAKFSAYGYIKDEFCGNFRLPWVSHRKQIPGEAVFGKVPR
jgi:thymidylate synthase ThyX